MAAHPMRPNLPKILNGPQFVSSFLKVLRKNFFEEGSGSFGNNLKYLKTYNLFGKIWSLGESYHPKPNSHQHFDQL